MLTSRTWREEHGALKINLHANDEPGDEQLLPSDALCKQDELKAQGGVQLFLIGAHLVVEDCRQDVRANQYCFFKAQTGSRDCLAAMLVGWGLLQL